MKSDNTRQRKMSVAPRKAKNMTLNCIVSEPSTAIGNKRTRHASKLEHETSVSTATTAASTRPHDICKSHAPLCLRPPSTRATPCPLLNARLCTLFMPRYSDPATGPAINVTITTSTCFAPEKIAFPYQLPKIAFWFSRKNDLYSETESKRPRWGLLTFSASC